MTKEFMLSKAAEKYGKIIDMFNNPSVKALDMFEELTCSVFAGDEFDESKDFVLKQDKTGGVMLLYRGFEFEILECVNPFEDTTRTNPIKLTSDCFICFCYGHHDICTGKTFEETPDENKDIFCPIKFLVPDAWCYGYPYDRTVKDYLIPAIDKWLDTQDLNKI